MTEKGKETLPFFVYGTLLPGQPNDYLWGKDVILATEAATLANGRLYDMGHYPMLVAEGNQPVQGKLVYVRPADYDATIARLDYLEGYDPTAPADSPYRRVQRQVQLANGRFVWAWVYLGQKRFVAGCLPIAGNSWVAYAENKATEMLDWWHTIDTVAGLQARNDER